MGSNIDIFYENDIKESFKPIRKVLYLISETTLI
jgi:hypothetical protein